MCLAIPGQIVEISAEQPLLAHVNVGGVRRNVNIGLLDDGESPPGDWVLIHVGFALSKIDEEQAHDQLRMLRAMGEDQLAIEEVRGYAFADGAASAMKYVDEFRDPGIISSVAREIARTVDPARALPHHGGVRRPHARDLPARPARCAAREHRAGARSRLPGLRACRRGASTTGSRSSRARTSS